LKQLKKLEKKKKQKQKMQLKQPKLRLKQSRLRKKPRIDESSKKRMRYKLVWRELKIL
jgi:hypothetical protein